MRYFSLGQNGVQTNTLANIASVVKSIWIHVPGSVSVLWPSWLMGQALITPVNYPGKLKCIQNSSLMYYCCSLSPIMVDPGCLYFNLKVFHLFEKTSGSHWLALACTTLLIIQNPWKNPVCFVIDQPEFEKHSSFVYIILLHSNLTTSVSLQ